MTSPYYPTTFKLSMLLQWYFNILITWITCNEGKYFSDFCHCTSPHILKGVYGFIDLFTDVTKFTWAYWPQPSIAGPCCKPEPGCGGTNDAGEDGLDLRQSSTHQSTAVRLFPTSLARRTRPPPRYEGSSDHCSQAIP